jgi:DNA-binding MarR family transcriptional regulator
VAAKSKNKTARALALWHGVTTAALKSMPLDLSARQMAILLAVHLEPAPQGLKRLSKNLSISKPAVCRAVDVLESAKLLRRTPDKKDKRTIFILPTAKGRAFLQEFAEIVVAASK